MEVLAEAIVEHRYLVRDTTVHIYSTGHYNTDIEVLLYQNTDIEYRTLQYRYRGAAVSKYRCFVQDIAPFRCWCNNMKILCTIHQILVKSFTIHQMLNSKAVN